MRIICTDMFFDGDSVVRRDSLPRLKLANVSFAWVRDSDERFDLIFELGMTVKEINVQSVPTALDSILRRERFSRRKIDNRLQPGSGLRTTLRGAILNPEMISYIEQQPLVIERSPPEWVTLKSILGKGVATGSTSALAIFIVLSADPMMFVKVPGAYLAISTTKALSKWIEKNLPKLMDRGIKRLKR